MADIQNTVLYRKCKVCGTSIGKGKQYCEPCRIEANKKCKKVVPIVLVKECIHCGKEFKTIRTRHKYCSMDCSNKFWQKNNADAYKESKRKSEIKIYEIIKQKLIIERQQNPFYGKKLFTIIEFKKCSCCGTGFVDRSRKLNIEICRNCRRLECKRKSTEKQIIKFKERSINKGRERNCCTCGVLFSPLYGHGRQLRSACSNECHELFVKQSNKEIRNRSRHVFRIINKHSQLLHGERARFKRIEIYERDRWICKLCGKKVNKDLPSSDPMGATLDHIIPLSKGGLHIRENVQLAHRTCNSLKGDRSIKKEQLLLIG